MNTLGRPRGVRCMCGAAEQNLRMLHAPGLQPRLAWAEEWGLCKLDDGWSFLVDQCVLYAVMLTCAYMCIRAVHKETGN